MNGTKFLKFENKLYTRKNQITGKITLEKSKLQVNLHLKGKNTDKLDYLLKYMFTPFLNFF